MIIPNERCMRLMLAIWSGHTRNKDLADLLGIKVRTVKDDIRKLALANHIDTRIFLRKPRLLYLWSRDPRCELPTI